MSSKPAAQIKQVQRIFSKVAPVYDMANHVLSLGQDFHWRRFTARCLRPGPRGRVLDVACGTGDLALQIARRPERPLVVGLDLVPAMLKPAQAKASSKKARLALLCGDGTRLPFRVSSFDAVTIAFGIRNIPHRHQALTEMLRVLTPQGRIYILEFTTPHRPWLRKIYRLYLKHALVAVGAFISGDRQSYRYLAETILEFPSPPRFREEMRRAGFKAVRSYPLTQGITWLHIGDKE
jgi:demethylmenaquinone methyltransferase/2-methoxy-6-polyprenyl-1,4-benzoquinol methylase